MAARLADRREREAFMGEEHRAKIKNSSVLNRLIAHAEGKCPEMTKSEVTAAIALMRKVLPDLASVEHSGDLTHTYAQVLNPLPDDEWQRKYSPPTVQ